MSCSFDFRLHGWLREIAFKFQEVFQDCIVNVLRDLIGERGMRIILLHIESGDYLEDPAKLQKDLHIIFGVGAENIEKVVVKELFRRLNLSLKEREDFDFGRSVQQARELFVARIKSWNHEE